MAQESRDGRSYLVDNKSGKSVKLKKSSDVYIIYQRKGKECVAAGKSDPEPSFCADLFNLVPSERGRDHSEKAEKNKKIGRDGKDHGKEKSEKGQKRGHSEKSGTPVRHTPKRRCKTKTSPTRAAKPPTPAKREVAKLKGMAGWDK